MTETVARRRTGLPHVVFAAAIILVAVVVALLATKPVVEDAAPLAAAIFTVIIFAEILTAFLLIQRYLAESDPRLLALAATYLFTGLLFVARQLVAPGAFSEDTIIPLPQVRPDGVAPDMAMPLMLAGRQAGMWLWVVAHVVFPVGIALAMTLRRGRRGHAAAGTRLRQYRLVISVIAAVAIAAAGLTAGLIYFASAIPIIRGEGRPALLASLVTLPVVLPLAYWRSHRRGGYDRWVLGALAASTADVVLTTLGGQPFTVGWFAGRLLSIIAASVLLVAIVGEISQLYRNLAVVHERLTFQAAHDVLTGALGRRALMDRVERIVAQSKQQRRPAVLAIVDLDHLKQLNDRYGHLVGDRILSQATQRMRAGLRDGDILGRYGGDEFLIAMPDTEYQDGAVISSRVLRLIRTQTVDVGSECVKVTATIGITSVELADESVDQVMARADAALYDAKARGRNQVVGCRTQARKAHQSRAASAKHATDSTTLSAPTQRDAALPQPRPSGAVARVGEEAEHRLNVG